MCKAAQCYSTISYVNMCVMLPFGNVCLSVNNEECSVFDKSLQEQLFYIIIRYGLRINVELAEGIICGALT